MTYNKFIIGILLTSAVPTMAFAQGSLFGPQMSQKKIEKTAKNAEKFPFGSEKNPVRADFPLGQRAYIERLRCSDGSVPKYHRQGSTGLSPYKTIMDIYEVDCGEAAPGKVGIYMDMYHPGYVEAEPIEGFTITEG